MSAITGLCKDITTMEIPHMVPLFLTTQYYFYMYLYILTHYVTFFYTSKPKVVYLGKYVCSCWFMKENHKIRAMQDSSVSPDVLMSKERTMSNIQSSGLK